MSTEVQTLEEEITSRQAQIEEIQASCTHEFHMKDEPKLVESLVAGVFVGTLNGPAQMLSSQSNFTIACSKCDKKEKKNIHGTCPQCLAPMGMGPKGYGFDYMANRKEYFGSTYIYYAVAVIKCTACSFAVARDEWDQ